MIRNTAYGFSWTVLATKPLPYKFYGNLYAKDKIGMYGWCYSWVEGTKYFHFKAYLPTIFGKCLKFRNLANSLIDKSYPGKVIKYCNSFKEPQK